MLVWILGISFGIGLGLIILAGILACKWGVNLDWGPRNDNDFPWGAI